MSVLVQHGLLNGPESIRTANCSHIQINGRPLSDLLALDQELGFYF